MKDFCSFDNIKVISRALELSYPKLTFHVNMTYDAINFTFIVYVNFIDDAGEAMTITVFVDDSLEFTTETILYILMDVSEVLNEMGYQK